MDATAQTKQPEAGLLTGEQILGVDDHALERVECPEWGGHVYVRTLEGQERDLFEQSFLDAAGNRKQIVHNIRAGLLVRALCDQRGQRLFSDKDIARLGKKNAKPLDRLFDVAQRLSGLSDKDIEEIAKNLQSAPSDGSTST